MLRIDQLRLHPGQQETLLRARCAKLLRVAPADITACTVLRKAIDAREDLTLVYTVSVSVKNEAQVLRRCRDKRVSVYKQEVYFLPPPVTARQPCSMASIDKVYSLPEAELHDLRERIESRKGLRQLSYMKELRMGNGQYRLVRT